MTTSDSEPTEESGGSAEELPAAIAMPVEPAPDDPDRDRDQDDYDDEELGSGRGGRILVGIGSIVAIVGLFLTWYHVVRTGGSTEDTSGWQTFTRLRFVILVGAVVALGSVVVRRSRALAVVRVVIGLVLAILVVRRVVSPPDLTQATVTAQIGIYIALLGAVAILFGGLIDGSSDDEELEDVDEDATQPVAALEGPQGELPPGGADDAEAEVVDADVVESDTRS